MHPDYPIEIGKVQISEDWQLTLKHKYNRRIDDESLVFWRPKFTVWINIWGNDYEATIKERINKQKKEISSQAFDIRSEKDRFSYRLDESDGDGQPAAFYGFVFGESGHVQLAIYFDDEKLSTKAEAIYLSFEEQSA